MVANYLLRLISVQALERRRFATFRHCEKRSDETIH